MKYNAVIFDMDGLLFDTELVYYEATQVVADKMGFPYDKDLYLKFLGVSDEEVWANYHMIFSEFGKTSVQRFIDDSYQETLERFSQGAVQMKPGVLELLSFLEEHQIPKVVASSNQRAKPDPEIFLLANQKLGTAKKETLILEDSQNGILAASAAEIPVVMVPDLLPPSQELIKKTAGVVSSLHEIPALLK